MDARCGCADRSRCEGGISFSPVNIFPTRASVMSAKYVPSIDSITNDANCRFVDDIRSTVTTLISVDFVAKLSRSIVLSLITSLSAPVSIRQLMRHDFLVVLLMTRIGAIGRTMLSSALTVHFEIVAASHARSFVGCTVG